LNSKFLKVLNPGKCGEDKEDPTEIPHNGSSPIKFLVLRERGVVV